MNQPRRYPGAKPFAENQAHIFYGRDEAINGLHRLVRQEELVVLHAKSGIGKSSLIKAGLLPMVRKEESFYPIEVRLFAASNTDTTPPVDTMHKVIELATANQQAAAFLDKLIPEDNSLWRTLKHYQLSQAATWTKEKEAPSILLIFDQFEELFTYPPSQQLAFRRQLAEALHTRLPQRYWDTLSLYEGMDGPLSAAERQLLQEPMRIHVLMAIREDRIHLLGGLADYLPMISKNWFELQHLSESEATQAIEAPASREGDFATLPFTFQPEARNAIIQYLSEDSTDGIDSTQLQVICDFIDRRAGEEAARVITQESLGDLKQITEQYYRDKLADITDPEQQLIARKLIEDELIYEQAERRLSLFSGVILDYGLTEESLKILVDGYLLRAEPDLRGGYNYELSHDSLVKPILEAKRERVAKEAQAERERQAREQQAKLEQAEKEKRAARRLNVILFGLLGLAILAIGAAVWGLMSANNSRKESEKLRGVAQAEADRAE
ncbi:MAG: hypothetical protein AAFQ37_06745, partial [Bacteroidota bacterium]